MVSFSDHYTFSTCISIPDVGRLLYPQNHRDKIKGVRRPPISPLTVTKEVTEVAPDVRVTGNRTHREYGTSCSPYVVPNVPPVRIPCSFAPTLFLKRFCKPNRRIQCVVSIRPYRYAINLFDLALK